MRATPLLTWAVKVCAVGFVFATPSPEVNATLDFGTFESPAAIVRPRFRYWLPDPSIDVDVFKSDIEAAARIGSGGIELLPFFQYGGRFGGAPAGSNWTEANFGTPMFRHVFEEALRAHEATGTLMDFALGPNQGQGVPASENDGGLQYDLVPFTKLVNGSTFHGVIPGWGTGDLISLVSAQVVSEGNQTLLPQNVTFNDILLRHDTLLDRTDDVSPTTGEASLDFSAVCGSHYRLFAFYQTRTLHKNLAYASGQNTSIFDHGSYVVDHFSRQGAETISRFWERHMLTDEVRSLLSKVGRYGWEDSPEVESHICWSDSIPDRFEKMHGYSLRKVLPLLAFEQNNIILQPRDPGSFRCTLDTEDQGKGYVNDFRATLGEGYREYQMTLKAWLNGLGLEFRAQPSYNLPLDMTSLSWTPDAPECESLGFSDSIDLYRQFVGPIQLAGKRVISNEMGAARDAFGHAIPYLLFSTNRAFASGVNQMVLHGQSFSGNYYATTWPGHVPFGFAFSELYSNKLPSWDHGFSDVLGYMARTQQIQQTGVPRIDVAVYNKISATRLGLFAASPAVYNASDLVEAGWSYTYLSPDNFKMPEAKVERGVLAPEGPSWKALVIQKSSELTFDSLVHIQEWANAGLPVIFSGGLPSFYPTGNHSLEDSFSSSLSELISSPSVHTVETGAVASKLSSLGLRPNVAIRTSGSWYTTWRATDDTDYALILADVKTSSGEIVVASTKKPYFFNAWSGERTPIVVYEQDEHTTTIPLSLNGNQTVIIAFSDELAHDIPTPPVHVVTAPSNVIGQGYSGCSGLYLHVAASTHNENVTLSTGESFVLHAAQVPPAFNLSEWSLTAEHWEAPDDLSDASIIGKQYNTTHTLPSLVSWTEIPGLVNASGVGYYETSFDWRRTGPSGRRLGAKISFPGIVHAVRIFVNGHQTPPLDLTNAAADISEYLHEGRNEITAVVPTTLWNYMRTILGETRSAGRAPLIIAANRVAGPSVSGLVKEVVITPYEVRKLG